MTTASNSPQLRQELAAAIARGDEAVVRRILDGGMPVDYTLNGSESSLMMACRNGKESIARLLIERGANVKHQNTSGLTGFHYACKYLPNLAIDMIGMGADINHRHKDNLLVPIITVIESGHDELAKLMLDKRVKLDVYNERKETPCVVAALKNRGMLSELIAAGANPSFRGRPQQPVLHQIFQSSESGMQKKLLSAALLLIGAGASVHERDDDSNLLPTHVKRRNPEISAVIERVYRAPICTMALMRASTPESLLGTKESLLDNPRVWWQFDTLLNALAVKGKTITAQQLHDTPNAPDGKDYLSYAVRCSGFEIFNSILQAHGDCIAPRFLVDEKGAATPLLNQVIAQGESSQLLKRDYWVNHSSRDLIRVLDVLVANGCENLPYHQLTNWKRREEALAKQCKIGEMRHAS